MKRAISLVSCLMSLVLASSAFAAAKPVNPQAEVDKRCRETFNKLKVRKAEMIDAYEAMRREPMFATNAYCRAAIDLAIINVCRCRGIWELDGWDFRFGQKIPAVAQRSLDDADVPFAQKVKLGAWLAEYLAGEKCYAEAEKLLRTLLADRTKHTPDDEAKLHLALADNFRWQDRFADAWKATELAAEIKPEDAVGEARRLADADGNEARAEAILSRVKDPLKRLDFKMGWNLPVAEKRKLALDFVLDAKNDPADRAQAAIRHLSGELTPETKRAFAVVKGLKISFSARARIYRQNIQNPLVAAYGRNDWALVAAIFETFRDCGLVDVFTGRSVLAEPGLQTMYVVALAADGRKDAALEVVGTNLVNEKIAPLDKAKLQAYRALLTGGDVEKAIGASGLERKQRLALVTDAARVALALGQDDLAEKLAAKYEAAFFRYGPRELKVAFSKDNVLSVSDWRKLYDGLDKQVCDRAFGVDLEALATDVASRRELVVSTDRDSKDAQMEVTSVCDLRGLHIFLHVVDPKAREVEAGFAGGIGTEMYFSPGRDQPYVCFGANPRTGVPKDGGFQTTYDCKTRGRIDLRPGKGVFEQEIAFTDDDYVLHLFFAWDTFYRTMPTGGSRWRFECLAFGPGGAKSLGGSRGVHNTSTFCDLVFALKPADVTAIRRAMLYRTAKSWRGLGRMDRFDRWGDVAVGDVAFSDAVLRPLEKELDGYAKMVTMNMSDTDVNLVFEKALPRWKGISHEIDALRKDWLKEKLFK